MSNRHIRLTDGMIVGVAHGEDAVVLFPRLRDGGVAEKLAFTMSPDRARELAIALIEQADRSEQNETTPSYYANLLAKVKKLEEENALLQEKCVVREKVATDRTNDRDRIRGEFYRLQDKHQNTMDAIRKITKEGR